MRRREDIDIDKIYTYMGGLDNNTDRGHPCKVDDFYKGSKTHVIVTFFHREGIGICDIYGLKPFDEEDLL